MTIHCLGIPYTSVIADLSDISDLNNIVIPVSIDRQRCVVSLIALYDNNNNDIVSQLILLYYVYYIINNRRNISYSIKPSNRNVWKTVNNNYIISPHVFIKICILLLYESKIKVDIYG